MIVPGQKCAQVWDGSWLNLTAMQVCGLGYCGQTFILCSVFPYIPSLLCNPALFPDCQCIEKRVHEGELTARCVNSAILGTQRVIAHST